MRCVVEMGGLYEVPDGDRMAFTRCMVEDMKPVWGAWRRYVAYISYCAWRRSEAYKRCVVEMGGLYKVRGGMRCVVKMGRPL